MIARTSDINTYNNRLQSLFELFFNEIQNGLFKEFRFYDVTSPVRGEKNLAIITQHLDTAYQMNYQFKRIDKESIKYLETFLSVMEEKNFVKLKQEYYTFASPVIYFDSLTEDNYYICYLFMDKNIINTIPNIDFFNSLVNSLLSFYSAKIEMKEELVLDDFTKTIIYKNAGTDYFSNIIALNINYKEAPFLFQDLIKISELPYESLKTKGTIIFTNQKLEKKDVQFKSPISIRKDIKAVRKCLELTNTDEKIHLYSDCNDILGIHHQKKTTNYNNCYFVTFNGNSIFTLSKNTQTLLIVKDGIPNFPKEKDKDDIKLTNVVKREFSKLDEKKQNKIIEVISNIKRKQKHGAVIIVTDDAKKEAERFSNMAITFTKPVSYNKKAFITFSEIDGAIILDLDCNCHAIGVILDGNHKPGLGTSKRGSRYNGTLRYYETQKDNSKLIAIVISEDGYFNVFPES